MKLPLLYLLLFLTVNSSAQQYVTRDIKSFGAIGDGKTIDHDAFVKAANFFNKRGGNGKLIIPKGTYLVGKQDFTQGKNGKAAYFGYDVLHFKGVKNFIIEGKQGTTLKYIDSLRFGAFNPETGMAHPNKKYFIKYSWAALIGHCIFVDSSESVTIKGLDLDGNNKAIILGGGYGDKGRQLPHYGIFIQNSKSIIVENVQAHHFALDGICLSNRASNSKDDITITNSTFEYNSRQGFSWIGGNDLRVKDCRFNHTGKSRFSSPPGAGVDIEAEVGPVRGGKFENCEFINNTGVGMLADNGNSREIGFKGCTFWGVNTWAVWVNKPAFTFKDCKVYGSFAHGYNAINDNDATKFVDCHFEDKDYEGKPVFGKFLVESNNRKRVSFNGCTFVSHNKKLLWIQTSPSLKPEEKYQFNNCQFVINNSNLPSKDYIAVIRGIRYQNCTFRYTSKEARAKKYYLNSCCGNFNVDEGGNKIVYE